jgi:hypothetical protein
VHLSLPSSENVLEQQPFAHSLLVQQNHQSPLKTEVGEVEGVVDAVLIFSGPLTQMSGL